ncbi:prolyl oligopeptidase family serine peptidase [Sphaerisporangium sp. NPDC051011]|uniref:prolyl oligopeptidase family serine peptidase n=1 Tax=Sphaerisporangium sp. NPDC051011 TaxID=3155792 RepID=UPI0033E6A74B
MDLSIDSSESLAWQADRDEKAAARLAGLPGRESLKQRIAGNLTDTRVAPVTRRGDRWFQLAVLEPDAEQPVAVVRDAPAGEPRVLVDPNELTAKRGRPVTLLGISPSPDGRTLAYLLMEAGTEVNELRLIDVRTGEALSDELPWNVTNFGWLADSSSFLCTTREVIDGVSECPVYRHVLGTTPGAPIPAPKGIIGARPVVSADGRHVALMTGNTEQRLDWIVQDGDLRPFLRDLPGGFTGAFHGDDLIALVDDGAPRGRLVRIPVATAADPSTWVELVAESEDVLRYVDVVGDEIVLGYLRDATCRVRLLDLDGTVVEELDLPGDGTVSTLPGGASHPALPMFASGDDEISFIYSSFDTSWTVYRYIVSERRLEVVTPPAVKLDGLVVTTITAVSSDDTPLPTHVVHRADIDTSMPQPTLIYGYGGFNLAYIPSFVAEHAAWVESGGVFVLSHLRGGSDFGAEWWRQGTREHKQQTFDDLYAVAEHLIETGRTTPQQLAVKGESNGGLLAGAAITQRPDLWAAVVADVPILDLIGYERDPLTYMIGRVEYGDPRVPVEAEWLRAISPVHNVQPAAYPAVLVTAGANDPRCPVWHSRVFVDLLERAQTGDAPVLLRVYSDQGHTVTGLDAASSKNSDWLAFVAAATGLGL